MPYDITTRLSRVFGTDRKVPFNVMTIPVPLSGQELPDATDNRFPWH